MPTARAVGRQLDFVCPVPKSCPQCGTQWEGRGYGDIQSFLLQLRRIVDAVESPLRLELELYGEEE